MKHFIYFDRYGYITHDFTPEEIRENGGIDACHKRLENLAPEASLAYAFGSLEEREFEDEEHLRVFVAMTNCKNAQRNGIDYCQCGYCR